MNKIMSDECNEILKKFDGLSPQFWDCSDPESLSITDPIEAIEEFVDRHLYPNCDVAKEIEEMGWLTVDGYDPKVVTDSYVKNLCHSLMDNIAESFSENYGDPDGDGGDLPEDVQLEYLPKMKALVKEMLDKRHVWRCEVVTHIELSAEEVITLMKHYRKDWFETK